MILCLDIGNSQLHGGVFENKKLRFQFRKTNQLGTSSDEFGLFFRSVLKENNINYKSIKKISVCSVVPEVLHSLKNSFIKYFNINPFILQAGVRTGLKIKYRNPLEVGSDRIANAIAASHLYSKQNLIIIDFGTATTFCAVTKNNEYLGGVIHAGLRISMEALESKTSKLPSVEILKPNFFIGRSTVESIQSGLYHGAIGMVKEIRDGIINECFSTEKPFVIGTGGFAKLLLGNNLFDVEESDLVLKGLYLADLLNSEIQNHRIKQSPFYL